MKTSMQQLESKLLGMPVIKISGFSGTDEIINWCPDSAAYVYCELPATDLVAIHALENAGFRYSEFRIKSTLNTDVATYSTRAYFPFVAEIITEKVVCDQAISMLNQNPCDDRFSNDPLLNKNFSAQRNAHNLKKSFRSWPNEFLLGIFNTHTLELVAFRSGAVFNKTEAHLYQYGIASSNNFDHTADMMEAFTIEYLKQQGIKYIHAVSTGFNIPELNRLTQNHGFKMVSSHIILRKMFNP